MYVGRAPRATLGDYSTSRSPGEVIDSPTRLVHISNGSAGMVETLKVMRQFARDAVRDPEQRIRDKARELLSGIPPRQWMAEIKSMHAYVRDSIRYMRDPVDLELVQTPEKTIELGVGDCDDKATLLAALLTASGHPSQFVAIGFGTNGFSHVLVETQVGTRWMPLETIIPVEAGWFPDDVTRAYRMKV